MLPNDVLFENDEFSDDYIEWNLPSADPLTATYYSNGTPVSVSSMTSYHVVSLDGSFVEQYTGLNADGDGVCAVEITQTEAFSTALLQHSCTGVNELIIAPPERPPIPTDPWSVLKWTVRSGVGPDSLTRVVASGGLFQMFGRFYNRCGVTATGESVVMNLIESKATPYFVDVVVAGGFIYAINNYNKVMRSADNGATFSEISSINGYGFSETIGGRVFHANGKFLLWMLYLVGGVFQLKIYASDDMISFTETNLPYTPFGLIYDGSEFVTISDDQVLKTSDITTWPGSGTPFPGVPASPYNETHLAFIDGVYVAAVGNKVYTAVSFTPSGNGGWTEHSEGSTNIQAIVDVGDRIFFLTKDDEMRSVSSSFLDWRLHSTPRAGLLDAAVIGNRILVVGEGGFVATLEDVT